jgi:hypothetical protein
MHGGRRHFYCQYKTCKRSTENPFARLENLKKHLCNVHNEQGIESHEPARRDGHRPTEVVSKLDSDMQSPSSSSDRLGSKDGRQGSSEKINRARLADLKAESSSIQAMYKTQGAVITDLVGQLSKLQAQLEDRMRE